LDLHYVPASGFMARTKPGPQRERPHDWLVWHFTHRNNLEEICASGSLLPSSRVHPRRSVANEDVKGRRTYRVKPDEDYPESTVRDHVPFYIAAKSPMLFAVTSPGTAPYKALSSDLVFIGVVLGDLIEADLIWCISNGNASSEYTQFSRDLSTIGGFVDYNLLCQTMWNNTPEDQYRQGRRAAECLALGEVPLHLSRVIVTRDPAGLTQPRELLKTVGGARQYHAMRDIFYN
jgi:hypothetical protein